jgi:hypothetical protein
LAAEFFDDDLFALRFHKASKAYVLIAFSPAGCRVRGRSGRPSRISRSPKAVQQRSERGFAIEKNADCWGAVCQAVSKNVDSTLATGARDIQVAFRGGHFSNAFTLNAFLVLLTARAMKRGEWLRPNCDFEQIISATTRHHCVG